MADTRFAGARFIANTDGWAGALRALIPANLILLIVFKTECVAAISVWTESTAYGHCFLVLPIAGWLAWDRREAWVGLTPQPSPLLALLALPLIGLWLMASRLGLMEGRQFAVLGLVWVLTFAVLGIQIGRALATPLAYLTFLVPFGAFLVPSLQGFTAGFIDAGLNLLDIPHVVTDLMIEIPEGDFRVAEACAGLRFLIAALAFGTLYACVIYRSPARRVVFVAACIVVPILANGIRALAIVVVGHIKGSAAAGAVDHILYGWMFFTLVILLLLTLGLPFRQDGQRFAPRMQPMTPASGHAGLASLYVLAIVICGPVASAWLDHRAGVQTAMLTGATAQRSAALVAPVGCISAATTPGLDNREFLCGGHRLDVEVRSFSALGASEAFAARRDAMRWESDEDPEATWLDTGAGFWETARTVAPDRTAMAALFVDGQPVRPGLRLRVQLALTTLRPKNVASHTLTLIVVRSAGSDVGVWLAKFAAAQP